MKNSYEVQIILIIYMIKLNTHNNIVHFYFIYTIFWCIFIIRYESKYFYNLRFILNNTVFPYMACKLSL